MAKIVYTIENAEIVSYSSDEYTFSFSSQGCHKDVLWITGAKIYGERWFYSVDWSYDKKVIKERLKERLLTGIADYASEICKMKKKIDRLDEE